ncbi:MAG: hypothetical protein Q9216_002124 [Gyalolechia sp. 2 TL-2023]
MSRLVRRQPLVERIKAWLNPVDFLLWLSEEIDSSDWEQWQEHWSNTTGISLNIVFLIARANTGSRSRRRDDVFADDESYGGFTAWLAIFVVYILTLLSIANAIYTFSRRRHYRLFESSIDAIPSTPSAQRVRVDSSPLSSSPLRFLSTMLAPDNVETRSHPDATRDVWELAIWDPTPLTLRLFCLFSPGHIFLYWLYLPIATTDDRPSTTIATTIALAALLSSQLIMLQCSFSRQSKDSTVVHKEVQHEYDAKFVHPRTRPLVRDVGTQYSSSSTSTGSEVNFVETRTPSIVINRGFHTRPNPNYMKHIDPNATASPGYLSNMPAPVQTPQFSREVSSSKPATAIRQQPVKPNGRSRNSDGGNLGVFSHANSPLRKSASAELGDVKYRHLGNCPAKREGSPLKKSTFAPSTPLGHRWAR